MTDPAPVLTPLTQLLDLSGRVAVVTGAGRGIGAAISRRLAEAGATVHVADLDEESAVAVAGELGGKATAHRLDVRDVDGIAQLARTVVAQSGTLDIWVNNAGIFPGVPLFGDFQPTWDLVMEINLRGTFAGIREAARQMIKAGTGGVIVNLVSIAADRAGHPSMTPYGASKAGVVQLTKYTAAALGPWGIRVVGVSPGVVMTPGLRQQVADLEASGLTYSERGKSIPLRRLAEPDDIARTVVYLASDLASYITGHVVPVDGGDVIAGLSGGGQTLALLGLDTDSD